MEAACQAVVRDKRHRRPGRLLPAERGAYKAVRRSRQGDQGLLPCSWDCHGDPLLPALPPRLLADRCNRLNRRARVLRPARSTEHHPHGPYRRRVLHGPITLVPEPCARQAGDPFMADARGSRDRPAPVVVVPRGSRPADSAYFRLPRAQGAEAGSAHLPRYFRAIRPSLLDLWLDGHGQSVLVHDPERAEYQKLSQRRRQDRHRTAMECALDLPGLPIHISWVAFGAVGFRKGRRNPCGTDAPFDGRRPVGVPFRLRDRDERAGRHGRVRELPAIQRSCRGPCHPLLLLRDRMGGRETRAEECGRKSTTPDCFDGFAGRARMVLLVFAGHP